MRVQKKISLFAISVFIIAAGILMSSQQSDRAVVIQQLIEEAIEAKVERYKASRNQKCKEKILDEAGKRADSIVIAKAKALRILQDTIIRPNAPDRPTRPAPLTPIDSSEAKPLLENPDSLVIAIPLPDSTG